MVVSNEEIVPYNQTRKEPVMNQRQLFSSDPSHDTCVVHGGHNQRTRYNITQHDYAGGGNSQNGGYIEVLEIKDPPDGHCGIVINEWNTHKGGAFTEWETLEDARAAFGMFWGSNRTEEEFPKLSGFKRRVVYNTSTPWFYAGRAT